MGKTRNERKRDELNHFLVIVLVTLTWLVCFVYYVFYCCPYGQPEEVSVPEQEHTVTSTFVVQDLSESLRTVEVEYVPLIPDEVAQQEAQMPEFGYDYGYVCAVVAAECRGEPYEGQLAVAQCIRTSAERKMLTPEEVVKLPNRYADPCTYAPDIELVRDACCDVFVHGISATDAPIEYFYSTVGGFVSEWHENNLEFVMEIGSHRFFKEVE
jgi:hypothetical protein